MNSVSLPGLALGAAVLVVPSGCVASVWLWARSVARSAGPRRVVARAGYACALLGATSITLGLAHALFVVVMLGPSSPVVRSRVFAHGIAETFYAGVIGLLVALVGGVWMAFWTWRRRKTASP